MGIIYRWQKDHVALEMSLGACCVLSCPAEMEDSICILIVQNLVLPLSLKTRLSLYH